MIKYLFYTILFLILPTCLLHAQPSQNLEYSTEPLLQPTIVEIEFPGENTRIGKPISTKRAYYMEAFDETPIYLERRPGEPARLYIQGGANINHVEIYEWNAPKEAYPTINETFRVVNFKEIDINRLSDGMYRFRVIYLHSEVETLLELKTLGTN